MKTGDDASRMPGKRIDPHRRPVQRDTRDIFGQRIEDKVFGGIIVRKIKIPIGDHKEPRRIVKVIEPYNGSMGSKIAGNTRHQMKNAVPDHPTILFG